MTRDEQAQEWKEDKIPSSLDLSDGEASLGPFVFAVQPLVSTATALPTEWFAQAHRPACLKDPLY